MADEIIVHFEDTRNSVVKRYRLPTDFGVHVIPHGHYCSTQMNAVSRDEAHEQLGLEHNGLPLLGLDPSVQTDTSSR